MGRIGKPCSSTRTLPCTRLRIGAAIPNAFFNRDINRQPERLILENGLRCALKQQDLMVAIRQMLSETQPDPVSLEPEIADSGVMA
jgi:hypothetical protein